MRHAVFTIALFAMGCGPEEEKQATTTTTDTASTTVTTSTPDGPSHPQRRLQKRRAPGRGLLAPGNTVAVTSRRALARKCWSWMSGQPLTVFSS